MVTIINVAAFLDTLAWSEGIDNGRQKTRNHGYDVIVGGELFTDYSDHPRKLVTYKPKPTQQAPDATSFSRCGMPTASAGLKDFSPKSQDAVALQQIKERGAYLWLIVVISVRQSTVAAISWPLPGAGYGQFEHKADSLIAKFSMVNQSQWWDLSYESHRDYSAWLSASPVCLSGC